MCVLLLNVTFSNRFGEGRGAQRSSHAGPAQRMCGAHKECAGRTRSLCAPQILCAPHRFFVEGRHMRSFELHDPHQNGEKTLRLTVKRTWWIRHAQTLIKPVEYEDFRSRFCKTASKSIKKH